MISDVSVNIETKSNGDKSPRLVMPLKERTKRSDS